MAVMQASAIITGIARPASQVTAKTASPPSAA